MGIRQGEELHSTLIGFRKALRIFQNLERFVPVEVVEDERPQGERLIYGSYRRVLTLTLFNLHVQSSSGAPYLDEIPNHVLPLLPLISTRNKSYQQQAYRCSSQV